MRSRPPFIARTLALSLLATPCACDSPASERVDSAEAGTAAEQDAGEPSPAEDGTLSARDGGVPGSDASTGSGQRDAGDARRDAGGAASSDGAAPSSDAGSLGRTCGGFAGLSCAADQFCNYEPPAGQGCDGQLADAAGVCAAIPDACDAIFAPVCGCDGKSYDNRCDAHVAGVSVAKEGTCDSPQTSCDRRPLTCRRAEPACPEGQVVSIIGNCFGECVPIDQCACSEPAACPQPDKYTCHRSAMHCGPYVN